ncbi:UNVERIFIED_CONTAM: hypothetical protein HDU68_005115 [Siphonaria sp. JEL0065]|nr:hypothetical protein HDU68_005115 [Siphonaria sp. JEL0065]
MSAFASADLEAAEAILQMNGGPDSGRLSHSPCGVGEPSGLLQSLVGEPIVGSAVAPGYHPLTATATGTATIKSYTYIRTVACWSCRRFRKKCINAGDGTPCTRCTHRGKPCTYSSSSSNEQRESPEQQLDQPDQPKAEALSNLKRSSASEAQLIQGFKKRKKAVSCMSCYAKKLKCCRTKPCCAGCTKRGTPCVYNEEASVASASEGKRIGNVAVSGIVNSGLNSNFGLGQPPPAYRQNVAMPTMDKAFSFHHVSQGFMQSAPAVSPRLSFIPPKFNLADGAEFPPVAPKYLPVEPTRQKPTPMLPSHPSAIRHDLPNIAGLAPAGATISYVTHHTPEAPFTSLLKPVQQHQTLPPISHILKSWDPSSNSSTSNRLPQESGISSSALLPPLVQKCESVSPEAMFNTNETSPVMSEPHRILTAMDHLQPMQEILLHHWQLNQPFSISLTLDS